MVIRPKKENFVGIMVIIHYSYYYKTDYHQKYYLVFRIRSMFLVS